MSARRVTRIPSFWGIGSDSLPQQNKVIIALVCTTFVALSNGIKTSRLLVKTFKRKVLLFSYSCSIKKVNNMVDLFTLRGIDRSLLPSFFRATIDFRLAFRLEDLQSRKFDFSSLIFLLLFASAASMRSHVVFLRLSR